jgi:hypothetical protein
VVCRRLLAVAMAGQSKGKSLLYWLNKKRQRRRRRRGDKGAYPRTIQDVLQALEPEVFQAERERCPVTHAQWQEVVGIRIADRSVPRRLDPDGTLLVGVTSSVWAQELSLLSSSLCQGLRANGHKVRSLRFSVGQVVPPRRGPERYEPRYVPAPVPIPGELQQEINAIEDEGLRDVIEKAAASSLAVLKRVKK